MEPDLQSYSCHTEHSVDIIYSNLGKLAILTPDAGFHDIYLLLGGPGDMASFIEQELSSFLTQLFIIIYHLLDPP